jgi:hypothetical protein
MDGEEDVERAEGTKVREARGGRWMAAYSLWDLRRCRVWQPTSLLLLLLLVVSWLLLRVGDVCHAGDVFPNTTGLLLRNRLLVGEEVTIAQVGEDPRDVVGRVEQRGSRLHPRRRGGVSYDRLGDRHYCRCSATGSNKCTGHGSLAPRGVKRQGLGSRFCRLALASLGTRQD